MRTFLVFCLVVFTTRCLAAEPISFDSEHPPEPDVAAVYKLTIKVGKGVKPADLLLALLYPGELEVRQTDGAKITISRESTGLTGIEMADYDLDGRQDIRVLVSHGKGGSGYQYLHYDGRNFVEWKRATELSLTSFDFSQRLAYSGYSSGPAYHTETYRIARGDFHLIKRETYNEVSELRKGKLARFVPKGIGPENYLRIEETFERDKFVKRRVYLANPWEDDSKARELPIPSAKKR